MSRNDLTRRLPACLPVSMMPRRRLRALLLLFSLSALDFSGCFVRRRIITRKGSNSNAGPDHRG